MNTDTVISFSGWIRRDRAPWRLFCRGATEQAVLDRLLKEAPFGTDKPVQEGSSNPNDDAPAGVRRRRF
jgi:hypothetical protein